MSMAGPTMMNNHWALTAVENTTPESGLRRAPRPDLEQRPVEPLVGEQFSSCTRRDDASLVKQIGPRGQPQQSSHVLPGGENREAVGGDGPHGLAEAVRHGARQPEEGIVETEQPRTGHEAACQGQHLLFAAREDVRGSVLSRRARACGRKAPSSRFSRTDSGPKSLRPSGIMPSPRAAMSYGARPSIRSPSSRISPLRTGRSPVSARIKVDLPAPLGPTSATNSPVRTSSENPWSTSRSP